MRISTVAVVLVLTCSQALAQQQRPDSKLCLGKKSCGDCIGVSAVCVWCQQTGYSSDRCDTLLNHQNNGCLNSTDLIDPENEIDILRDEKVSDGDDKGSAAIQVQPQRIAIKLRPNKPVDLELTFRQAANYPVDIYFLMDLSSSMRDDQKKTAALASELADSILKLTNNVRFGFGSFVDKVALPFTSTEPSRLKSPCPDCAAPYSFKHMLPFSTNMSAFKIAVEEAEISGNLDGPEGGLDALIQAAVCVEAIGWRDVSRKLILYLSDATFHSAGDGKLAGIVMPNDGLCHLDENGYYTEGTKTDYPSVGQIRDVIREKKINLIFAVPAAEQATYRSFSNMIEGSTVGTLAFDSQNIVSLVYDNYQKISSRVQLESNKTESVSIKYQSKCLGSEYKETNACDGLRIGEAATFDIELSVNECPSDPALRHTQIVIGPVGLVDSLTLEVELICECDCQKSEQADANSPLCNGNGTFACGICDCRNGRRGRVCECDGSQLTQDDQGSKCQAQNSSLVCSGRGECVCGECYCLSRTPNSVEKFSGDYCQCDDYSCDLFDGMVCGGPTRGQCRCGTCICNAEYNGTSCDCPISQSTCLAPNGAICNGQGECNCGKCKCDKESRCYGDFCEHCPSCVGNCNCNKDCVNCRLFKKGIYNAEECENKCGNIDITEVEILEENDNGTSCQEMFSDQTDCTFKFSYEYGLDNKLRLKAQKVIVCPEPADILPLILGVVGSVLIGIISLIIWKVCVTVYDHREYTRFKEEIDKARWASEQNPLYREAIQTFENPMCDGARNGL